MLAVSPFRSTTTKDEDQEQIENFSTVGIDDFSDLSDENLLESIDFDDLFDGINGGEVLPDLEMDSEILAEFYISGSGEEDLEVNLSVSNGKVEDPPRKEEGVNKLSGSAAGSGLNSSSITRSEEIVSRRDDSSMVVNPAVTHEVGDKGRKSSTQPKNNQGKRKVDWTPELHRRFVQAVEQLGLDKAVPSRILELMGTGCLTRHNIASHLQKYRSHRKHFLEREAEAARWSQRPKMNAAAATVGGGGKVEMNPWHPPTMGFPPTPITTMHHHHPFRPLHVWGHPYIWSKRLAHSPSPPPPPPPPPLQHIWAPPPPAPSYWHQHHRVSNPNGLTQGTPFFPQPLPQTRFGTPPVQGIPPHTMYKVDSGIGVPTAQLGPQYPLFDFHPSKESIDAAIGDVLSKPWLPLPLRLKPPSLDSVLVELQRQGIRKIPPACTS